VILGILLLTAVGAMLVTGEGGGTAVANTFDSSPQALGLNLFENYVFPFEVTGILLIVAIIGVAIFTLRKKRGAEV
jgi:NADH-quinone oxidoreductase subunit J